MLKFWPLVGTRGHRWDRPAGERCQNLQNQILVPEKKNGAPPAHGFREISRRPRGRSYAPLFLRRVKSRWKIGEPIHSCGPVVKWSMHISQHNLVMNQTHCTWSLHYNQQLKYAIFVTIAVSPTGLSFCDKNWLKVHMQVFKQMSKRPVYRCW